ncbi:MAG: helix-turn-helix domain-containing protein [Myxococcota bacterium]
MIRVNLEQVMLDRRMSLDALSRRVGISRQCLWNLKVGRAHAIRLSTLEALCEALDCTPGDLLQRRDQPVADAHLEGATSGRPRRKSAEDLVLDALEPAPRTVDDLVLSTGLEVREVLRAVTELELAGLLARRENLVTPVVESGGQRARAAVHGGGRSAQAWWEA